MSIFTFLTLILIVLKMTGLIAWPWVAVFAPVVLVFIAGLILDVYFFNRYF